jgi:hypothetical protein
LNDDFAISQKIHVPFIEYYNKPVKYPYSTDGWIFTPADSMNHRIIYKWKPRITLDLLYHDEVLENSGFIKQILRKENFVEEEFLEGYPENSILEVEWENTNKYNPFKVVRIRRDRAVSNPISTITRILSLIQRPIKEEDLFTSKE